MSERGFEPGIKPHPKPIEPHTDSSKLSALLKSQASEAWLRQPHERGQKLMEVKRDALVVVQDAEQHKLQFIVVLTRDLVQGTVNVDIVPTNGALQQHPELAKVSFSALSPNVNGVREAFRSIIDNMAMQNYTSPDLVSSITAE